MTHKEKLSRLGWQRIKQCKAKRKGITVARINLAMLKHSNAIK